MSPRVNMFLDRGDNIKMHGIQLTNINKWLYTFQLSPDLLL